MEILENGIQEITDKVISSLSSCSVLNNITDFLTNLETEIDNFEKTGRFNEYVKVKNERSTDSNNAEINCEQSVRSSRLPVVEDHQNILTRLVTVKLERISEVSTQMLPLKEPPGKGRPKKNTNVNVKKEEDHLVNSTKNVEVKEEMPIRSTRTKTRAIKSNNENSPPKENKESNTEEDAKVKPVRSTRTKPRTKQNQLEDCEREPIEKKSPKKPTESKSKGVKRSCGLSPISNEAKRKKSVESQQNIKFTKTDQIQNKKLGNFVIDEIIPDKEDRVVTTPVNERKVNKINNKQNKPIFSAYKNSPVKKRIEAFEKLGGQLTGDNLTNPKKMKNEKVKTFTATPIKNTTKNLKSQSSSKILKHGFKDVVLAPKSASALKACQKDYIEKQLEMQKKQLELLQAKNKDGLRKHEEQQLKLKTQEVKETLAQTKKDQKEVKRTPAKRTAPKLKYLEISPPLLPLEDCFDSDDERRGDVVHRPAWTNQSKLNPVLMKLTFTSPKVVNTFFMRKAATPDLKVLFGTINPKKLKRTSSAIWNKPPRFTIMPIAVEEDEYMS